MICFFVPPENITKDPLRIWYLAEHACDSLGTQKMLNLQGLENIITILISPLLKDLNF